MTQTECPKCHELIDSDSLYCDQCGTKLSICPKCGKFRAKKFCPQCGVPTVEPSGNSPVPPQPVPVPAAEPMLTISCKEQGVSLKLKGGSLIGRVNGPCAAQLANLIYLSGSQARVDYDGRKWTLTDIGSRNGTKVNGIDCQPNVAVGLKAGDKILFSTVYTFIVE